ETPLELGVKFLFRQRDDARRLLRPLGPDDRGSMSDDRVALERQDREWAGGEKKLLGPPRGVAPGCDRRGDGRLTPAETVCGNARALADRRMCAVGGDEEPRGESIAVG